MTKTQQILNELISMETEDCQFPVVRRLGYIPRHTSQGNLLYRQGNIIFVRGGAQVKVVEKDDRLLEIDRFGTSFRYYQIV